MPYVLYTRRSRRKRAATTFLKLKIITLGTMVKSTPGFYTKPELT